MTSLFHVRRSRRLYEIATAALALGVALVILTLRATPDGCYSLTGTGVYLDSYSYIQLETGQVSVVHDLGDHGGRQSLGRYERSTNGWILSWKNGEQAVLRPGLARLQVEELSGSNGTYWLNRKPFAYWRMRLFSSE